MEIHGDKLKWKRGDNDFLKLKWKRGDNDFLSSF